MATLTSVYADSTIVLGPLATKAQPEAYDLYEKHISSFTAPGHNGMPQPSAPLPYNPQDHMPAPVQGMGAPQGEPQQYYPQQQPPLSADYAQGQQWQGQQYPQQ